jgi:hypothetical protein
MATLDRYAKLLCEHTLLEHGPVTIHPGHGRLVAIGQSAANEKIKRLGREVALIPLPARKMAAKAASALWLKIYQPLVLDWEKTHAWEDGEAQLKARADEQREYLNGLERDQQAENDDSLTLDDVLGKVDPEEAAQVCPHDCETQEEHEEHNAAN